MFLQDLGHCFVKHPALRCSSIRPFTMDRLPYIHKSQKKYFQAFSDKISKHAHTEENTCKGTKSKQKVAAMGPLSSLCYDAKHGVKFGGGKMFSLQTEGENRGWLLFSRFGYGETFEDHLPQRAVQLKE